MTADGSAQTRLTSGLTTAPTWFTDPDSGAGDVIALTIGDFQHGDVATIGPDGGGLAA